MKYQVQIEYVLSADGPVLVSSGSGNKLHPELPDSTFLTSRDGGQEVFVIPGSTLKGVVRHYLCSIKGVPAVDSLFGDVKKEGARKSRIAFSDAFADMDTIKTAIRYNTALGSVSQSAKGGSLNNCQAVIRGRFPGNIRMNNVSGQEIDMIVGAFSAIDNRMLFIGGKSSRGFGRMRVDSFVMTVSDGYDKETLRPHVTGRADSLESALSFARQIG